jgi:hypothetical protein
VRVLAGDHEYMYALTLPQLWDSRWDPPPNSHRGIPRFNVVLEHVTDIWPWLALLGGAGLLIEWLLYGRFRLARFARRTVLRWRPSRGRGAPMRDFGGRQAACSRLSSRRLA